MRMDIYSRIEDLVEEMRGDWRKFFESDAFEEFVRHYIQNLISGVYESLRLQGAQIAPSILENDKKFKFERIYDPNEHLAWCSSEPQEFIICINGNNRLVGKLKTADEKFELMVGHIVHEVGHRLFTDFRVSEAQALQMAQSARFFPHDPSNYAGATEGVLLQQKLMSDVNYRKTFSDILMKIANYLEDGYVESEMQEFYPGLASSYLGYKNTVWLEEQPSLTDMANEKDVTSLEMVLAQWLLYSKAATLKVGERPIEDFDSAITDYIWSGLDLIDVGRSERDPLKRADIENQLTVLISPLIDKAIEEKKDKQKSGSPDNKNQKANQMVQNAVNNLATLPEGKNNGTSKSIVDPKRPQNSGLTPCRKTQISDHGEGRKNSQRTQSGNGPESGFGSQPLDHSAALRDLQDTLETAATEKVAAQMEHERKLDMQREAKELLGGTEYFIPKIHRAENVAESNRQVYRELSLRSVAIAKRMARLLKKHLQDSEAAEYTPWQYSGKRFVSKQYCRNELKGFAKKGQPSPVMKCRVYVLVDESGSVTNELSDAEMKTCIVLEQFCRELDIPVVVQGYTSSANSPCDIFSYVEEKRIDDDDRYRLTGMKSRGGTPTANAMKYAVKRLEKNDRRENKILFVITDGAASDDSDGSKTRQMIKSAEKINLRIVGCGIGDSKSDVEKEFGKENYLGIDNLTEMPERLLEIIRRKIYSHR